jgi:hypothetical protein
MFLGHRDCQLCMFSLCTKDHWKNKECIAVEPLAHSHAKIVRLRNLKHDCWANFAWGFQLSSILNSDYSVLKRSGWNGVLEFLVFYFFYFGWWCRCVNIIDDIWWGPFSPQRICHQKEFPVVGWRALSANAWTTIGIVLYLSTWNSGLRILSVLMVDCVQEKCEQQVHINSQSSSL